MGDVTRPRKRRRARIRATETPQDARTHHGMSYPAHGPLLNGLQLPLSLAPYRLQAADRWWQQAVAADAEPRRQR